MSEHLNLFEPYANKAAHHEDALTRAFLVVLRAVPVAHASWLQLVDEAHRANKGTGIPGLHSLGVADVLMQTATIPDAGRVVSLVQCDELYTLKADAKPSDRRQVLDGVIRYGSELAIVLENKPSSSDIWEAQLAPKLPDGAVLDPRVACVTWKDIVLAWAGLLSGGRLSPAEGVVLGDFLSYVERHFSRLRPYAKVSLCGRDEERLTRRCRNVLVAIAGDERVKYHAGWGWFVQLDQGQSATQIALMPMRRGADLGLIIEIDPGDTTSQARTMFAGSTAGDLLALDAAGWTVRPNLHVSHMTKNLFWTRVTRTFGDYWGFFVEHRSWLRQWRRDEFGTFFDACVANGLATAADRPQLERHLLKTERKFFNLCPGVQMRWWLSLDTAALLDERDELEDTVRSAIAAAASPLHLHLPWVASLPAKVA